MFRPTFGTFGLYNRPNMVREMEALRREMNQLFERNIAPGASNLAPSYPAMNAWTNEDGAVVTAELPGVKAEEIEISVVNDTLTLSGARQPETGSEKVAYHRRERRFGKFSRSLQLPFTVDADKVEAVFQKGILHISLPRAESEKPRKIAVKTA